MDSKNSRNYSLWKNNDPLFLYLEMVVLYFFSNHRRWRVYGLMFILQLSLQRKEWHCVIRTQTDRIIKKGTVLHGALTNPALSAITNQTCAALLLHLYGKPNRPLMLIFWYQKMIFWYQKMIFWYQKLISDIRFSDIRKSISDIRKCVNFWYQKIIFWYQKLFLISENMISEIIFWYQKFRLSDIRKQFLISENRISDVRKSALKSHLAFHTFGSHTRKNCGWVSFCYQPTWNGPVPRQSWGQSMWTSPCSWLRLKNG